MDIIINDFIYLFFFNDTATTEIYTLSLHDALPICRRAAGAHPARPRSATRPACPCARAIRAGSRAPSRMPVAASAETPCDVCLCAVVLRRVEQVRRRRELDQLSVPVLRVHEQERGEVRHSCRLLHVVRDDDDREVLGER